MGAGGKRGEKGGRCKPYSNGPPRAMLGSLDIILKPTVEVVKRKPRVSFEFRKSLRKDWS